MSPFYNVCENQILDALLKKGVRFVVVGGAVVQYYGVDRSRADLDILLEPMPENAARFVAALQECHLPVSAVDEARLGQNKPPLQLRLPPPFDIDVLTSIQGVAVEEALRDAVFVYGGGVRMVPILSKAHLISNKRARGEEKDLNDIAALEPRPPCG